jgi:probable rRNA maturation factor
VNQNQIEINPVQIERVAEQILNSLGYTEAELSIAIVDDEEMTRLNRQYRQVDSTTDVLAFSMREGEFADIDPQMLGDVVISAPTAMLMTEKHRTSLSSILNLLLVHGILHLVGYDHERGDEEAKDMEGRTLVLLNMLEKSCVNFDWFLKPSDE